MTEISWAVHRKGWPMTAHSQGGGAIDTLLDSFTALDREKPIAPSRSHLMHASFQSPEAMARARKLGVLVDVQSAWLHHDGPALERVFGSDGMRYFFPLQSYVDAGIIFASGSDHMIGHDKNTATNEFNPFLGLWSSVTRLTTAGKVLRPEQRISRENALRSYTAWGAYLQHVEKDRGSIEVGKLADLVVIDRNYLTCPESEIRAIQPTATVIGGKVVAGKLP
ncbi:MAG: amidohydrolase family protein [Bryobacteraceae bacterium]